MLQSNAEVWVRRENTGNAGTRVRMSEECRTLADGMVDFGTWSS